MKIPLPFLLVLPAFWMVPAAALSAGATTSIPVIVAVKNDAITVRTGRHAGLKVTDADGDRLGPSNIETYKVNQWTEITVDGLKAQLADVRPKMRAAVTIGMDRTVARSIVASTIPEKQPKRVLEKRSGESPEPRLKTRSLGSGVLAYQITAMDKDTITVAQKGGGRSRAYRIGQTTTILVDGEEADFSALRVGRKVQVSAGLDPTLARRIEISDQ